MEKNHNHSYSDHYDSRNKMQVGEYRGVGIPAKVGSRATKESRLETKGEREQVPPLKFN